MNELAKIHIAKKELGLTDQSYRDIIAVNFGGKSSAKELSAQERASLLALFAARGWKKKSGKPVKHGRTATSRKDDNFLRISPTDPDARQKRYILAMWNALGYDVAKLHARCKKQFGVDRFEWLDDGHALHVLIVDLQQRCHQVGIDPDHR